MTIWQCFKAALKAWNKDNATIHGAALAYYTAFSIAPLIVIAIGVAGIFFGKQTSEGDVFTTLNTFLGASTAKGIQGMVQNAASAPKTGVLSAILGTITLLVGASGVFQQLQQSLNLIWNVQADPSKGIWGMIRQRFLSFSMIGVVAFLLLVSLVASALISALGKHFTHGLAGGEVFWNVVNNVLSFGVITALFAMLFKVLPDVKIRWKDVWIGSAFTAGLFVIGKFAIGLYLAKSSVASSYGAAGSLVLLLLWVYYSSLIVFFGSEFTKLYATRNGREVALKNGAQRLTAGNSTPAGNLKAAA